MCFTSLIAESKKEEDDMPYTESCLLDDPSHLADSKTSMSSVSSQHPESWSLLKTRRIKEKLLSFHFKNFTKFTASTQKVIFVNVK